MPEEAAMKQLQLISVLPAILANGDRTPFDDATIKSAVDAAFKLADEVKRRGTSFGFR
jgi:hypothetical protein